MLLTCRATVFSLMNSSRRSRGWSCLPLQARGPHPRAGSSLPASAIPRGERGAPDRGGRPAPRAHHAPPRTRARRSRRRRARGRRARSARGRAPLMRRVEFAPRAMRGAKLRQCRPWIALRYQDSTGRASGDCIQIRGGELRGDPRELVRGRPRGLHVVGLEQDLDAEAGNKRDRATGSLRLVERATDRRQSNVDSPPASSGARTSPALDPVPPDWLAIGLLCLLELAAQPADLGQLIVRRSERIRMSVGLLATRTPGGRIPGRRSMRPATGDLAAMDETVASEWNEVGLRIALASVHARRRSNTA